MKISLRKTDTLFSQYLRKKRNWSCEKCHKFCPDGKGLQISHFWGRRNENTRFDEENCDVLCFYCHQYFHERPAEYTEWKRKQLGEREYKKLMLRANQYRKRDDKLMVITLKALNKLST